MREVQELQGGEKELSQNLFIKQKCLNSEKPESLHSSVLSPWPLKTEGSVFFYEEDEESHGLMESVQT